MKPSWEVLDWEQARESLTADYEVSDGSSTSLLVVRYHDGLYESLQTHTMVSQS